MTLFQQFRRGLARTSPSSGSVVSGLAKWTVGFPGVILVMTLLAVLGVLVADHEAISALKGRVHEEHRLRLRSCQEHVQNHFDSIYSTLLFISLDKQVRAHSRDSYDYLSALYGHEREERNLRRIYVVGEDFTETKRPLVTLGAGPASEPVRHESEEHRTIAEHLRQFAASPGLKALVSGEISLCDTNLQGRPARGLVFSLPITCDGAFRGAVSATVETDMLASVLHRGLRDEESFLVDSQGEMLGDVSAPARAELRRRIGSGDAESFFRAAAQSFPLGQSIAIWTSVQSAPGQRWRLVYLYDRNAYLRHMVFDHALGQAALVSSLIMAGVMLALLVRVMGRRLNEQAAYMQQRRSLEREVQEASEREQRRIGEVLHEDLCQRLIGLEAASRVLEKRLARTRSNECRIAGELSRELHNSLTRFREIADELQPVPLFEDGFFAAVQHLTACVEEQHGIRCELAGAENQHLLEPAYATNLYRVIQEALNNVVKHARATRVLICLEASQGRTTLTITDDGVGMQAVFGRCEGMGLRMMHYRCDLMGADFNVGPASGGGTKVTASWAEKPQRAGTMRNGMRLETEPCRPSYAPGAGGST